MITLLQGWAIQNNLPSMPVEQWKNRPVLTVPNSNQVISSVVVSNALIRHARSRGEDPNCVVHHCLRHSSITALANSSVGANTQAMLAASGHRNESSLKTSVRPGQHMRNTVSQALQQNGP